MDWFLFGHKPILFHNANTFSSKTQESKLWLGFSHTEGEFGEQKLYKA